jgi:IS30 family transposase
MARHDIITKMTGVKVYFADPRSPWQRGTNENTNGLIRQYFPKGTDFNKVSRKEIKRVQDLLNSRPRKVLDWLTPYEAFDKIVNKCSVRS